MLGAIRDQISTEAQTFNQSKQLSKWEDHLTHYTKLIANCEQNIILLESEVIETVSAPPPPRHNLPLYQSECQKRNRKSNPNFYPSP